MGQLFLAISPIALKLGPFEIRWYALCIVTGVVVAVWLAMKEAPRQKIKPDDILDFILIAFPVSIIGARLYYVGRWGNFFNQEAFGKAVNSLDYLPSFIKKQMYIDNSYRTPTFLYESSWNLIGFILVMSLRHRLKGLKSGDIVAFYLVWYGIGRFVIEGMRTDSLMLGPIRISQALSLVLVVGGIILVLVNHKISKYFLNKQ